MNSEEKTLGFCSMCMQNVEHTRMFSSRITRILDFFSLGLLALFRIGPYYCFQCESRCYYLKPVRRDAPTFDSDAMTAGFSQNPPPPHASEGDGMTVDEGATEQAQILEIEPLGNLHKNEHSLVMQERRTQNFTVHFRDSIATRILQGEMNFAAAKNELNLKDADLIRWIADMYHRRLTSMEMLRQALLAEEAELPESIRNLIDRQALIEEGDLEGHVVNRKPPV